MIKIISQLICFLFLFVTSVLPQEADVVVNDSVIVVDISAVGDLMCHSTQYKYAKVGKDSFDFKPVFEKVKKVFDEKDFVIGNLEVTFGGKKRGYSGYPAFNTPDEFLEAVKYAGFDLMITANNHSLDTGKKGVARTIEKVNEAGLLYNGSNASIQDQDSIRIYDVKGIKLAILSYTYNTNSRLKNKGYALVNYIDTLRIKSDISKARNEKPDAVIVFYQFGNEYDREPSDYQKDVVKKTIEYGADIILGSHPHAVQPMDVFDTNNGSIDTGFVAYSLGNFVSNQRWRYSDCGVILNFELTKLVEKDSLFISDISYIPAWVYKGNTGKKNGYIIIPQSEKIDEHYISDKDKKTMEQSFSDTKEIINKYSQRPKHVFDDPVE